jgi:hypothetical protein
MDSCFKSRWQRLWVGLVILAGVAAWSPPPAPAATSRITGVAYQDLNRDGARQADEAPFSGHRVDLYGAGGAFLQTTLTDAAGQYQFLDLADGDYQVIYDASYWWSMRDDWVPTTTGSLFPKASVHLAGAAAADFGWRRIVRSTDVNAPISSYVGPNGLAVQSYDDVVSAREIYDAAMQGSLIGAEASTITIRFDYGTGSSTATSVTESNGRYSGYRANVYLAYVNWLDTGDRALFHEYGHAWSQYYAYMVQQDPTYSGYLSARGLLGDSRLGSSYPWEVQEIFAEDYRQLFGTANARTGGQLNGEIPLAADVAGLRDYLAGPYRQAPLADPGPTTPLAISGVAVTPSPVKTSGTVSFSVSAPGSITVKILSAKGSLVRTLLSSAPKPAGSLSALWDRTDSTGRRVKRGTYSARVDAVDGTGQSATASASFSVY